MIHWNASPEIIELGPLTLRWYGLLFAVGFLASFAQARKLYAREKLPVSGVDSVFMYVAAGTIIGARLIHCLFYEPEYYLLNPLEIFKVWQGGLASHGAVIGIILALWVHARMHLKTSFWWLVDMVSTIGITAGAFIRLGNFFNSEIYGHPTSVPWGVVFVRLGEGDVARHPTQLYEALVYFLLAAWMWWRYKRVREKTGKSDLGSRVALGWLFITVFTARFFLEFTKVNQEAFEMGLPVNMGQLLSIPFVALGVYFVWKPRKI